jgi:hypothetical protein
LPFPLANTISLEKGTPEMIAQEALVGTSPGKSHNPAEKELTVDALESVNESATLKPLLIVHALNVPLIGPLS